MNDIDSAINKMIELKSKYVDLSVSHWLHQELLTWQWWFSIFLYLIPLIVWWKFVDKKRLFEIMIFGLFVNLFCTVLDVVGTNFNLWLYQIQIIPNIPLFFPIDFVVIPVLYMVIYQYFPKWKHFVLSMIITALVFSFIGEPFDVWAKIYVLIHWKYIYSFPIYIVIGVVCKGAINWFLKKSGYPDATP